MHGDADKQFQVLNIPSECCIEHGMLMIVLMCSQLHTSRTNPFPSVLCLVYWPYTLLEKDGFSGSSGLAPTKIRAGFFEAFDGSSLMKIYCGF